MIALMLLAKAMNCFFRNIVIVRKEDLGGFFQGRLDSRHWLRLVQRRRSDRSGRACFFTAASGSNGSRGPCSRTSRMLQQRGWCDCRIIDAVDLEIISSGRARRKHRVQHELQGGLWIGRCLLLPSNVAAGNLQSRQTHRNTRNLDGSFGNHTTSTIGLFCHCYGRPQSICCGFKLLFDIQW